jgi:hypothetical protein
VATETTPSQSAQAAPFVAFRLDASGVMAFFGHLPEILNQELTSALEEIGSQFEMIAASETPEGALGGAGGLRGSPYHEVRGIPVRTLIVGWASPYADFVSRGRRPGKMPPSAPIELWARKVLNVSETELPSAVFLIRRKIGTKGTPGNPFDLRTFARLEPAAQAAMDQAAERIAARSEQG